MGKGDPDTFGVTVFPEKDPSLFVMSQRFLIYLRSELRPFTGPHGRYWFEGLPSLSALGSGATIFARVALSFLSVPTLCKLPWVIDSISEGYFSYVQCSPMNTLPADGL